MKQFEELKTAAEKLDCMELLEDAEARIRNLESRRQTGVFITGADSSGKTTLLNGIVGTTVREPSILSEIEKPLRVVFERQDDDERFECRVVANRFWNNEDAILYEVKIVDIILPGHREPAQLLDFADVVYYVISALAPFSREDMENIKLLSFLPVKVVLSRMDMVPADSQEKLREYVSGICANLGVGEPIIIRPGEWENAAKTLRAALPADEERRILRKRHGEMICRRAVSGLLKKAEQRLADIRIQREKASEQQLEMHIEAQEKQALWGVLRTRMLEEGNELSREISANVKGMAKKLTKKLLEMDMKEVSEPEPHIQKQMEKAMAEIAMGQRERVEQGMRADAQTMMESAVNLGLAENFDINETAFTELTSIRIEADPSMMARKEGMSGHSGLDEKGSQIIAGTAIAIGLFVVLPLPAAVSWIGGIAAAGIGGSVYGKNTKEIREKAWHGAIADYCKVNLDQLAAAMAEAVKEYYGRLADTIKEKAKALPESTVDEESFCIVERELDEIAEKCRYMLDSPEEIFG